MNINRRDFLASGLAAIGAGAAMKGSAGAAAGAAAGATGGAAGAPMIGFACKPMERVRVAVIGAGSRGMAMIQRSAGLPGVEIAAVCDIRQFRLEMAKKTIAAQNRPAPETYSGPEDYRRLCDSGKIDLIYNTTPWHLHVPVALAAMRGGKHVLTEVTAAMTVSDCWEMVETCEKNRVHCMQLENCIYGEIEMLAFNLARKGLLGEVMHAEGAYNHDGRHMANDLFPAKAQYWRYDWYREHAGNPYPTHGLVPLCLTMDVNRGDRMDYVVSLDSKNASFAYFMEHGLRPGNPRRGQKLKVGDVNTSLIKTVGGKSIMVQHTVSTPRPYSRIQTVQGTRGIISDYPYRIALENRCGDNRAANWMPAKAAEEIRRKYMHPLWKSIGDIARKNGGHGGMDYIQDARWAYCLRMGLPLDTTVYDLASTGCLCELTEKSAGNRSCAMDIPDFTRGAWKTAPKMEIVDIDLKRFPL